ncbi:hypothetical protein [Roseicyclus amphidinii]|uniref:hypothetical protein n=1 Tax=Roseicyclus amphidinii TaxID=3034232 RepID=UPI0024E09858|nr:hypothetical protein [Roseicyclus sp. Amp-Y-6]
MKDGLPIEAREEQRQTSRLTPLERELLSAVQDFQDEVRQTLQAQDQKIAALEAQIRTRDAAITSLNSTLRHLLGPHSLVDESSQASPLV